jgi:hypothetical protein
MLKFIEGHISSIEGVEIYPIISMLIFFIFFALLISWVITAKKEYVDEMSKIPFESNDEIEL